MEKLQSDITPLEALRSMAGKAPWRNVAIGAGIVVVVTLGFFMLFFNRFAGVRTGAGAIIGGTAILSGRIPYRDFFIPIPPFFLIENALTTWLFGTAVVVQRMVGVLERALMATVLYLWLARHFRISSATLGAIVAIVVSAGDVADPINAYHLDVTLWAMLAGLLASVCLEWRSDRSASAAALLCGISASLCFCDYQTVGLGITVAVSILVMASLWRARGYRLAGRFAAFFGTGWALPVAAISCWLYRHGALWLCLQDIFLKGPAAKAGAPTAFIVRWLEITIGTPPLRSGFFIATILLIVVLKPLFYPARLLAKAEWESRALLFVGVLSVASIGAGAVAAYAGLNPWAAVIKASIYFTLMACGLLAAVLSLGFLFGKLSDLQGQFWLLVTVGFVCAFMQSLSWPAFEAMVIPGLGFLVAAFLDLPARGARAVCYVASAILLFSGVVWKLWNPAAFNDWSEPPVMSATVTPSLPELWGMRLPMSEVTMLEGAARIIHEHSTSQDTIFTYPTLPIFYAISHRWWPGFAPNHNFDYCPDNVARADAARILQAKPAVIIYYRQTPKFLKFEETLWRGGKGAGQRDIIATVEELVKHYKLAASYPVPPTKLELDVYVRH